MKSHTLPHASEIERRAQAFFVQITAGLTLNQWMALVTCTVPPNVYSYDPHSRSVSLANMDTVPWPIIFVLSCFHKRHVFASRRPQRISE